MIFIIVVQFSLKNIKGFINSYQSFLLSCFIIANVEPRATSIGLRWEIKKAFIVSSNLGILAPVLEGNYCSIKLIFLRYWNLYELERYRFDYFVFMAKII